MNQNDTICAIATPPGAGGVGIVRISGPKAVPVLKKIWHGKHPVSSFESHKMYLGHVRRTPYAVHTTGFIDSALAVIMRSPGSYTGEDVVEISCHGGQVILRRILGVCLKAGARMAEPGEFTRRAFLNGKMDLAQAEAVADLINATTEAASRIAASQLDGHLSKEVGAVSDEFTQIRAFVEASIDFPEEDIEFLQHEKIGKKLSKIATALSKLVDTYEEGHILRDGVNVAIIGKPNVGKSSLFNALLGNNRAIVHHTSGTTRDLVKETVQLGGIAFHLTDAAGLRETGHEIEKIGIKKAHEAMDKADLIIFVLDGSRPLDKEDKDIAKKLDFKRTIICVNKIDKITGDVPHVRDCTWLKRGTSPTSATEWAKSVSALTGEGIDCFKKILVKSATKKFHNKGCEAVIITSLRHKEAIDEALLQIEDAIRALKAKKSTEFIAHHLGQAHDSLGRITGRVSTDTILDEIFSKFCIGK